MERAHSEIVKDKDKHDKFFRFRQFLIDQYKAGNRYAKELTTSTPRETVDAHNDVSINKKDKGMMKLYDSYCETYGKPEENGLGH
eukprot:154881-Pyramimonas_sp.AAC.1